MTASRSSRSRRRRNTSRIDIAPDEPRGQATAVRSSPWCCPSSVGTSNPSPGPLTSRPHRNRCTRTIRCWQDSEERPPILWHPNSRRLPRPGGYPRRRRQQSLRSRARLLPAGERTREGNRPGPEEASRGRLRASGVWPTSPARPTGAAVHSGLPEQSVRTPAAAEFRAAPS